MQRRSLSSIALVFSVLLFHALGGRVYGQAAVPNAQQLDQLLSPIALYPDTLLAQITTASTDPQQILDVDNWLQQNSSLTGAALQDAAQQQGFDPAFIALVTFPQVLDMMAQNIDDYAAIGAAFAANQSSVMDSVQRLRAQAYAAGALQNNQQQQVVTQNEGGRQIIVIQPANPQVVYVPVYDPTVVYVARSPGVVAPLLTFGAGIAIGALLVNNRPWGWGGWGWNWGRRTVIVNHNTWVVRNNYYRPPHPTYRPRPVPYNSRPGYGGKWSYRPPNYRPPYGNRPPNYRPPPSNNRPPPSNNRPPPSNNRPPPSNNRPPPSNNRPPPSNNRPPTPSRPPQNPPNATRPGPPNNQPGTRPAPQSRPAPTARPANPPKNAYAGYQSNKGANQPAPTGGRASAFNSNNQNNSAKAASNRGQQSMGASRKPAGADQQKRK
jgi:Protein of unknown function (DUF3300)